MSVTQTMAVEIVRDGWLRRTVARFRPAPSRPPTYHASRITRTVKTGPAHRGRHRHTSGGVIVTYRLAGGRYVSFKRRP